MKLFDHVLRDKGYLSNASPNTIKWYETSSLAYTKTE
jgi:hypothetical protein